MEILRSQEKGHEVHGADMTLFSDSYVISYFAAELPVPVWLAHRAIKTLPLWEYSLMVFWLNHFPETRLAPDTSLIPLICYFAMLLLTRPTSAICYFATLFLPPNFR